LYNRVFTACFIKTTHAQFNIQKKQTGPQCLGIHWFFLNFLSTGQAAQASKTQCQQQSFVHNQMGH